MHVALASTASNKTYPDNITRYTQLYTQSYLVPAHCSISYYVKVTSGDVGLVNGGVTKVFIDGIEQGASPVITADQNWHHVVVQMDNFFEDSHRYSYNTIRHYMRQGDESLIAFPALVPGIHQFNPKTGLLPGAHGW